MVGPWILFAPLAEFAGDDGMSDIQFLAIKEFDGKVRKNNNSRSTVGDLATLTADAGKDMYIAKAKVVLLSTAVNGFATIVLKINGVIVESVVLQNAVAQEDSIYEFIEMGLKVVTGQIIKLEVTTVTNATIHGAIQCWEEATGESPQIPPLNPV